MGAALLPPPRETVDPPASSVLLLLPLALELLPLVAPLELAPEPAVVFLANCANCDSFIIVSIWRCFSAAACAVADAAVAPAPVLAVFGVLLAVAGAPEDTALPSGFVVAVPVVAAASSFLLLVGELDAGLSSALLASASSGASDLRDVSLPFESPPSRLLLSGAEGVLASAGFGAAAPRASYGFG